MKLIKLKIWLLRYSLEFRRRTGWSFKESWECGICTVGVYNSNLHSLGCPIKSAIEDVQRWGDYK